LNTDTELSIPELNTSWIERFKGLSGLPQAIREQLVARSRIQRFAEGTKVFEPGQSADNLLLLLQGTVRVQQLSDTGREVFLYRVNAGDSCVLTTACMLSFEDYSAEGVAEAEVEAVVIPRAVFDELAGQSKTFRDFVFKAYSRRITDLFKLVDDIVFQRMDVRLARRLLELADEHNALSATHQFLATELGTAREVISRTLAEFQRRGWVTLHRGKVKLVDPGALRHLADSAGPGRSD
jgi:CRP/FNR family transcriptional regulator